VSIRSNPVGLALYRCLRTCTRQGMQTAKVSMTSTFRTCEVRKLYSRCTTQTSQLVVRFLGFCVQQPSTLLSLSLEYFFTLRYIGFYVCLLHEFCMIRNSLHDFCICFNFFRSSFKRKSTLWKKRLAKRNTN